MKKDQTLLRIPNMRFGVEDCCTYCGMEPCEIDHVIPWSFIALPNERRSNARGVTTYSCRWCNSRLGQRLFPSMMSRLMFIEEKARKLARKHKKAPIWEDSEINQLRGSLKTYVIKCQDEMRKADAINTWNYSVKFRQVINSIKYSPFCDPSSPQQDPYISEFFRDLLE